LKPILLGMPLAVTVFFALLLASCGKGNSANKDGAGVDATVSPDGGALAACLERPGEPPRPPNGRLPCELIPPGGLQ
jgi:hypothetical protein